MVVSTIGLYVVMILGNKNSTEEAALAEKYQADLNAKVSERQDKEKKQAAELSAKYYEEFKAYKDEAKSFNAAAVTELKTRDLKTGDGTEVTKEFKDYSMYYIGWLPDEKVFDSSFEGESLKLPLPGSGSYITGWNEGVIGMKVGGVREITMPADKGYGASGQGEKGKDGYIPPNTPLRFIVMAIPKVADIPFPKGTMALCLKAYESSAAQYNMTAQSICEMMGYQNEEK
jgi:FKBP-type peptidyl-prolyl cis-trans isomerase